MQELVPDTWNEDQEKCCSHTRRGQRRGPVTDILVWVECYSSLVSVLASRYPEKTPQFMAYQRTIVRAQRSFTGEGWFTYDTCYRRKAALTKSLDWANVDFTLYNETFAGRAKSITRCYYCLSEHHASAACMYAPDAQLRGGHYSPPPRQLSGHRGPQQICQLYNARAGNHCRFAPCKYAHLCLECRGSHPRSSCRRNGRPPPAKYARDDSPIRPRK